jgi:hypothetical protein
LAQQSIVDSYLRRRDISNNTERRQWCFVIVVVVMFLKEQRLVIIAELRSLAQAAAQSGQTLSFYAAVDVNKPTQTSPTG